MKYAEFGEIVKSMKNEKNEKYKNEFDSLFWL